MSKEFVSLNEDHSSSPLYSADLAPVPAEKRTWNTASLTALWIGMAVCIPTYLLASYMMRGGMNWVETLAIITLANIIVTVPMALNGHAGVKYGIPFPVLGRSSFGINGIHIASMLRGLIACGWFGVQTWIGGLAIYEIFIAATGGESEMGLSVGKFICFGIFWLINMYFVWKGTESIKWLELLSAPILIVMGILLIVWGAVETGSFTKVLDQSTHLAEKTASLVYGEDGSTSVSIQTMEKKYGSGSRAKEYWFSLDEKASPGADAQWLPIEKNNFKISDKRVEAVALAFRGEANGKTIQSSVITVLPAQPRQPGWLSRIWDYILWLTIMVGYWATMSLSIADITRYAKSQKAQVVGQFLGLPATMLLYSFVGVFVTCAAMINFDNILIAEDAPWDPVALMGKFDHPLVVIAAEIAMLIATLSTNIAANVIAPANAFSNLVPKKIDFKTGGYITGLFGILICPWWIMDEISNLLIFVSGLLGPVLGIMICDYFTIRGMNLKLDELYEEKGIFSYGGSGFNKSAIIAFVSGVVVALIGFWVPQLSFLYTTSWFSGFLISFVIYYVLMKNNKEHYKTLIT
ncbi:MAG: NCS1 family nucleobase:cation symporter-1 [Crocinitomicaceae bacterium]|nr:NCS1 family nucleobase:cation symporter-1 [Crocinitomicaceae bacterium]